MLPRIDPKTTCFMHIGKVGGHSISLELLSRFNCNAAYNGSPEQFDAMPVGQLDGMDLIIGHFSYCHTVNLPKERFLFSMVRDPIDRIISNYWYLRTYQGAENETNRDMLRLAKSHDIDSFIEIDNLQVRQVVENHQCMFFAGDWRAKERASDAFLELALSHLDEFDFIGLHERYVESMQVVAAMRGWLPWPAKNRLNVTQSRKDLSSVAPTTLERLREINRLDIVLYAEIQRRFQKRSVETLKSLVRVNSLAHLSANPPAPLPLTLETFADKPYFGEGWHTRTLVSGGYVRWIGPGREAGVYAAIDATKGGVLELYVLGWVNGAALEGLTVTANGLPCPRSRINLSEDEGPERQKAALAFAVPALADGVVDFRFLAAEPIKLADAGFPDTEGRHGSVAIHAVRLFMNEKPVASES